MNRFHEVGLRRRLGAKYLVCQFKIHDLAAFNIPLPSSQAAYVLCFRQVLLSALKSVLQASSTNRVHQYLGEQAYLRPTLLGPCMSAMRRGQHEKIIAG